MFDFPRRELTRRRSAVYIDEAEGICERKDTIETARIMCDLANVPLVLNLMPEGKAKIERRPQMVSRVLHRVEFKPLSGADASLMARELSEVSLADDLVAELHRRSGGSRRLFVGEVARAETFARRRGQTSLTLELYSGLPVSRTIKAAA